VDWYPWGEEAFRKAREEDKPIFLSIGYSSCHWCHVMAKESFEDEEVARLMNETFVNIKVDREERPDVDAAYMAACQALTGQGGWPLSVIMTPEGKPFFASTYIPRENRYGRIGMLELIPRVRHLWAAERRKVLSTAESLTEHLRRVTATPVGGELGESALLVAYSLLSQSFDESYGGFSGAPKFPAPHNLLFLLRYWRRSRDGKALSMVEKTLERLRLGGIFDQLGFGFHRYSTDERWLEPHFEKMLYDQAMLVLAYLEAYEATRKGFYRKVAEEVLDYVLRELRSQEGGFYSAHDADSEGEEGRFYLWTVEEVKSALPAEEAELAIRLFNIQPGRRSVLHLTEQPGKAGWKEVERLRAKLYEAREKRVKPARDEKILLDWNGLMVAALARAAQSTGRQEYAEAAEKAVAFLLNKMRDDRGRLLHSYKDGVATVHGFLDDYAFLALGLLELYEATFKAGYLKTALELADDMMQLFWDPVSGGFYYTSNDCEELIVRKKEVYDGAYPSGNSAALLLLLRLGRISARRELVEAAEKLLKAFSKRVVEYPAGYTCLLLGLDFALSPSQEVVIVGDPEREDTKEMIAALRSEWSPNRVALLKWSGAEQDVAGVAAYTQGMEAMDGRATAYVCSNYACRSPTTDPGELRRLLKGQES